MEEEMKNIRLISIGILLLLSAACIPAQNVINFDNQGWNSNQILASNFSISGYSFSSSEPFYTNYGYNFDVNGVSLYYVFQNAQTDNITITTPNNAPIKLVSFSAYQVSESSTDSLVVEGWNNSTLAYTHTYPSISSWTTLTLDYDNINKIVIRLDSLGIGGLTDYNFDNFNFGLATFLPPTLSSPANNSSGVSLTPTLSWSSVAGAARYRFEVNTKSDFTGTVIYDKDTLTSTSKQIGGLIENTKYYWRVTAFNSSGIPSDTSNNFNFTTGQTILSAALNGAIGVSTSPTLSWNKTSGASTYRLQVNTKSDFTGTVVFDKSSITDTLQALSGLSNNTTYYWKVTASSNALAKTSASSVYSFTTKLATTALGSPTNNASGVSLTLTLSWSVVAGADIYRLEVNTKSDFTGTVIYDNNAISSASKQIGGLFENTTYYWRVTALSNAGNSGNVSSIFNFTTTQSTLIAATNGAISVSTSPTLSWNKTNGANTYRLEVNTKSDFTGTVVFDNPSITDTLQALSGLSNNTTYYWKVTASSNALAKTSASSVYSFTTKLATTALGSPANNSSGISLTPTLSWSAVAGANTYRLEVNTKPDFSGTVIYDNNTISAISKQIGGLADNINYYWRVTALSNAGNSGNVSSIFGFTTGQSTLVTAVNGAISVSTSPTLSWNKTNGANTYRLEVNTKSDFTGTVVFDNNTITDTIQTLTGLLNNTTYYWRITASSNALAKLSASSIYSFTTKLTTTTLISPTDNSTGISLIPSLSWSAVAGADKYRLEVNTKPDFSGTVIFHNAAITTTSKQIGGLSNNYQYYWRVTALNNAGNTSDISSINNFTTTSAGLISPLDAATGVMVSPTIRWLTVPGASKYELQVNRMSDFTGTVIFDDSTLTDTLTSLINLAYNTKYYWRFRAKGSGGTSSWSAVYSFTTKLATTTLSSPANNSAGISLSPTLTWSAVNGADKYRLEVNTKSDFTGTVIYNNNTINATSKRIGGLTDNAVYYWRVTALSSAGNTGDASGVSGFTTGRAVLTAATNGAIGVSTSPLLSWNKTNGASAYRLEVNTSTDFTGTVVFDNSTITDTLQALSGLSSNTTYYWRVTASSNALAKTSASSVYSFTTKLASTTLSSPTNNASGVSLTPTLSWSVVAGADIHRLEVNAKSDFSGTVIFDKDTLSTTSRMIGGLADNNNYYWRVTAFNNAGNASNVSNTFIFTTGQIILSADLNGAMGVSTSPALSWNKTAGASTYRLGVNTKSDFTGTVIFDNSTITDTLQALSGLSYNTTYYWRVTASSNALGKTSTPGVYSFTTKLAAATPGSPANNVSDVSLSPTLSWSAVNGANKYRLEVNNKNDFTGTVIFDGDTISTTSKKISDLSYNYHYYWRVTALNNAGNLSDTSSTFIFTTAGNVTEVEGSKSIIPDRYALFQNFPNPFNPTTVIRYALPADSRINIVIYNILGQEIRELLNNTETAGYHEVVFNGNGLASGVYFYRIVAVSIVNNKEFVSTKKLILMK